MLRSGVPHQLKAQNRRRNTLLQFYSALLQAFGRAHIVATRVVARERSDSSYHHFFDLNLLAVDFSLISNFAASGI